MKKIIAEYRYNAAQEEMIRALAASCKIRELTAKILCARGIDTEEKIVRFLNPSKDNFLSPFLMRGMRELVDKLNSVKASGGIVAVFGDYDADGIGAAAILSGALQQYGIRTVVHIPERSEGYGMSVAALEKLISERSPQLIVTVDCGISNREEVEYIRSRGVDVVVTDHHELPKELPDCVIVNPKLNDAYPYDNLCSAGVAFKVACALLGKEAYSYLDIAAVSTVADSVPLVGENRDIVYEGLKIINTRPREAIRNLLAGKQENVTAQSLAFTIAPRINAAGRMGDAACALRLLSSQDVAEVYDLSCRLNEYNLERQQLCDEVYRSAKEKIAKGGAFDNCILLYDESWNTGLVGIVAAKIAEEFNRPAILFVKNGDTLKGSARTIESINIYEALKACSEYIEEFGGHAQAAGVNVTEENFPFLKRAMNDYLQKTYTREDFLPSVYVCEENFSFDAGLVRELERLEPCGVGNKKPLFSLKIQSVNARRIKQGSPHIALKAAGMEYLWFGGERALPLLACDNEKKIIFECGLSQFRGQENIRGIVRDMVCSPKIGEKTKLYIFRNNLLRLKEEAPAGLQIAYETEEEIVDRIKTARGSCFYGLLLLCSEEVPEKVKDAAAGLEVELFRLGAQNVGNAVLVSPAADAEISMYREIVYLDAPADFHLKSLGGKKVVVNREKCGYNTIAGLDTSREIMGEIYRRLRRGCVCSDSVDAALTANLPFPKEQVVFAAEVFSELGLLTFESGKVIVAKGKKSDLNHSEIYRAVCALKEKV